jgi:hypothetical protein
MKIISILIILVTILANLLNKKDLDELLCPPYLLGLKKQLLLSLLLLLKYIIIQHFQLPVCSIKK